jgi:uncharacterized membrane protein YoaK (UPF0700 family)
LSRAVRNSASGIIQSVTGEAAQLPNIAQARLERVERSALVSAILAASGGFLDAFTYVGHGHVFANAMTGNVVLMAIAATSGQVSQAVRHIPPILAFLLGVAAAQTFSLPPVRARLPYPAVAALTMEMAFLFAGGWLPPGFPSLPIVLTISFLAALQSSTFRQAGPWIYSSTMTTGNLRTMGEAGFRAIFVKSDPEAPRKAAMFAIICGAFLAGAALGGFCTGSLHNKSLWVVDVLLLIAWIPVVGAWRACAWAD